MSTDINPITDPNLTMINGPVNIIRLEGNVHGINKVLYLFMDYHNNVTSQTQCSNVFSQDVQKYFTDSFFQLSEGTLMYDFFLEIYPSELTKTPKDFMRKEYKEMYIEEVVKFFQKIFKYDSKKNKVSVNKLFKNVRLHYLDIRNYYKHNVHSDVSEMISIARSFMKNDYINVSNLDVIIDLLNVMKTHLETIVDVLTSNKKFKPKKTKIIKPDTKKLDYDALEYLADKIKGSYKYDDVKKVMNKLIEASINSFENTITEINETREIFMNYADAIHNSKNKLVRDENTTYVYSYGLSPYTIRKMILDIMNRVEILMDEKFIEFFARFTDIYFLRRFLDKDYITNAIAYTGALHSNTYIHVLTKYFDFKITNISHSKINDMEKLTQEVKKRSLMEIQELVLPGTFRQCSNMTDFPPDFL